MAGMEIIQLIILIIFIFFIAMNIDSYMKDAEKASFSYLDEKE